jgi:hypothetical protein
VQRGENFDAYIKVFIRKRAALKMVHIIGCRSEEFFKHLPVDPQAPSRDLMLPQAPTSRPLAPTASLGLLM